jgi:hypothetical protein
VALEIARDADSLTALCSSKEFTSLEPEKWPTSFTRHSAKSVQHYSGGLYIETDRFLSDAAGVFIPCGQGTFTPVKDDVPYHEQVAPGVFTFFYSG